MYCRQLLTSIAALSIVACSSQKSVPPARYAVLRFENLTPDPALDWMGRAASEILTREIGAIPSSAIYAANESFGKRPITAPGVSTEFSDALLAGANHVITGYFDLDQGALSFHLVEEDASTGRNIREVSAKGPLLVSCASLARQITVNPKPYPTRNEAAIRDFILGVEGNGQDSKFYEAAIAADPGFGDPYLGWSELALAHKDADAVAHILTLAQARKIDPAVVAKLQFAEATAFNDPTARTAALQQMVQTDPTNAANLQALGESEMAEHHFTEAAAAFAKGASDARPDLVNLKAYALMFAGDEKGALDAVHQYQTARPQDPNAIDSEGDVHFYFGEFTEAEKSYLNSAAKDPQFNLGLEVWKAAQARLMTGDIPGATQLFGRYRSEREKVKDPAVPFRSASWQFLTGDQAGGLASIHQTADSASNETFKVMALAQASIWELQLGRKADAIKDAEAALKAGQSPAQIPAAIVRFASLDAASLAELNARADKMFNGPAGAQVRSLAVGYSLYLARRYSESVGVWKVIYEKSNAADAAPALLYAGSLQESGHSQDASPFLKHIPPPSLALAPSFESLYFPKFFDWRGDHAKYLKLLGNTATPAK